MPVRSRAAGGIDAKMDSNGRRVQPGRDDHARYSTLAIRQITLKDRGELSGRFELSGWLVSSSWGTDAVINHTRGLGPVAKSMWGELRLLTAKGSQTINIDVMEIETIQQAPAAA